MITIITVEKAHTPTERDTHTNVERNTRKADVKAKWPVTVDPPKKKNVCPHTSMFTI